MTSTVSTPPRPGRTKTTSRKVARPQKEPDLSTYRGRFGARIRKLRERRNLTVAELHGRLEQRGVSVHLRTVYAWEIGTQGPEIAHLPALAESLGCTVPHLFPRD